MTALPPPLPLPLPVPLPSARFYLHGFFSTVETSVAQ